MTAGEHIRALAGRWLPLLGDDDFVCSPAGLWLALAAVASGAGGETAEELREALGVAGPEAAGAVTATAAMSRSGGLALATGAWSRVPLRPEFQGRLPDVGFGTLGGRAQGEIDAWVRKATGDRIERLPLTLNGGEDLVLAGALALKAAWQKRFPAQLTRDEPFTDGYGDTTAVPTMHQLIPARWAWRTGGATVVELPCEGGAVRVRFVLGEEGGGPAEVLPLAWAGPAARTPLRAEAVDLALPRFSLRTRTDVYERLPALGMGLAVRPDADFSGMSPVPLYVSAAVQEALVEIAEEGVEAAAVTAVAMTRGAAPPRHPRIERIAFDRPFGFVVLDGTGGLPLFAGWRTRTDQPADQPTD
ncbi:serpin family protein [Streptomyces sp. NPDC012769]|uniref:serpin family protein n=1 Tax=Streptomyces sp. NPDC012769 TaxID=3364848 RepID=UPI003697E324